MIPSNFQKTQAYVNQNNEPASDQASLTDKNLKRKVSDVFNSENQKILESSRHEKKAKFHHQLIEDIDPHFDQNKNVISSFPSYDNAAQIKEYPKSEGTLSMIEKNVSTVGWGYFRHYGSQLPRTVEVMKKTLQTAHQKFDNAYIQVMEENLLDDNQRLPMILDMEIKLLHGLLNIKNTYFSRNTDDYDGLTELRQLYTVSKQTIDEHKGQLKKVSQNPNSKIFSEKESSLENIEESSHNLAAYCVRYFGPSFSQAKNKILCGQKLLKEIFSVDGALPSTNEEKARDEVTNITWFLMYYALKQQQGFPEGSFIIENSDKLFDFMQKLHGCAPRSSSHFLGRTHDAWYEVSGTASCMPAQKKVVLFGLVSPFSSSDKVLFLKPENEGATTTYLEWIKHGMEYALAQMRKIILSGSDDKPGMQKERVPCDALQAFEELIKYFQNNLELYRPTLNHMLLINLKHPPDDALLWGIAYMHAFVNNFSDTNKLNLSPELDGLLNRLKDTWKPFDNLENRTGREVYINKQQLQDFLDSELAFS